MPGENPILETAKQRSLRVALDYYRWPDPIARTKIVVTWVLALLALGYVGWLLIDGRAGGRHASPGPVAAAHATWDHQCAECHRDFRPLHADSVDFVSLLRGSAAPRAALDDACLKCHPGPIHHSNAKVGETASCAACHRDHLGRNASIIRPADSQCTSCHTDIQSHRQNSVFQTPITNVTGFGPPADGSGPHPPFRSLKKSDPGNVKFNHWLHMQPGVAVRDARDPQKTLHLTDIEDPGLRERYKPFAAADGLITLDCTACHRTESGAGAPATGDYMQPITFAQHCQACHPLQVKSEADGVPELNIPHGLSPERLTTALDGLLLGSHKTSTETSEPTADESGALPLVPGKTMGRNLAQKIGEDVLRRRAKAAALVHDKCSQCHYPQAGDGVSPGQLPQFAPPNIPATWLIHARFDHRAHRNVECRTCHSAAYSYLERDKPQRFPKEGQLPAGYSIPHDDEQVMIANLESCVTCHAPPRTGQGGARHDCAECHLYHGRDHTADSTRSSGPTTSSPASQVRVSDDAFPLERSERPTSLRTFFTSTLQPATSIAASPPNWIGISSCAATGCHGDARSGAPAWRSALATWTARDPHAQAYEVLWTFRGREMTRLLSPSPTTGVAQPALNDDQHFQVLEQRCVGCHATPPAHEGASSPNDYQLGVHCESCHGPAGAWLHTHYRKVPDALPPDTYIATKDLHTRAGVCMGCHVGPSLATGQPQVVDHDLIAAGHPRLNFEFHVYLDSLPPHWDAARDQSSQSGAYHFRSWLAGQEKQAEHAAKLADYFQKEASPPRHDFVLFDCSACHHQLAAGSWHQSPSRSGYRPGQPPPAAGSLHAPQSDDWTLTLPRRIQLAETLLSKLANTERSTWDASFQGYLAACAVASDLSPESHPKAATEIRELNAALKRLKGHLGKDCFLVGTQPKSPTPYDTPTSFDPAALPQQLQPVITALKKLASAVNASPP
jgi:hypothetical protein